MSNGHKTVAAMLLAVPLIAGCGPPTETIDMRKYPWSYVNNQAELEEFLREYPMYADQSRR